MKSKIMILSLIFVGCSGSGGGGTSPAQVNAGPQVVVDPIAAPTPTPAPTATPIPSPTPQELNYYSVTEELGIPRGYTQFTGSCMQYQSKTYCWDDGEKEIQSANYCSFWGDPRTANPGNCTATTKNDDMSAPTLITANLLSLMNTHVLNEQTPTLVLANGIETPVSCTDNGTTLDCISFSIDLTQTGN